MAAFCFSVSLLPLSAAAQPADIRFMADALTLLLLVAMISVPVVLLAGLGVRYRTHTPLRRSPRPVVRHRNYRGHAIR
jgi:hypothetical protein